MKRLKEVVIVEGRYDKNTLSQVVEATIIETGGFGIFNDRQKQKLLRTLAQTRGLIVLTDPDGAGFVIRNFIKGCVDPRFVKQAYVPDIHGKERRKDAPSREGKLGVEGMRPQILLEALRRAGATFLEEDESQALGEPIRKADFYARGLLGKEGSRAARAKLLSKLELPEHLSSDGLLDVLNAMMSRDAFLALSWEDPPDTPAGSQP